MPAMDNLLKRMGFVRLSRFGLMLTPEGRIISLRPAVLDDGLGSRIVGWQDHDLAAMELPRWEPARPAAMPAVARRVASGTTPPPLPVVPAGVAAVAPPIPAPRISAALAAARAPKITQPFMAVAAELAPASVAPEAEVVEDEWEWTIALARARAAAEEVEVEVMRFAAQPAPAPRPSPMPRRTRQDTVPPPPKFLPVKTQPLAMVALPKDPIDTDNWPKTEPLGNIDYNDYASEPPGEPVPLGRTNPMSEIVRVAPAPAVRTQPRASSPVTVIPVPRLPRITQTTRIEPVVRTLPTPIPPHAPRRFPKGTGPVDHPTMTRSMVAPPPPIRTGDETSPGIALPPAAVAVALPKIPSIKQRMSSQG